MAVLPMLNNLRRVLQKVIFVPIVYGFVSLLPLFMTGWENSDRLADRLFSTIRSKENMFDFVVVGAGTAGILAANRLAEHYKVLLLEAGGTPSPFQTIPALALKNLNLPQTDWSYRTVPQRRACLNSVNQQSSWSAGKGLGGSSNINFMALTRGHPMDFENWAEITGDPSWSYSSVLPYFKRYETFSGTSNDPEARGHDGELRIRKPSYIGLSEDWIRAGQELGYPFVDLNGRHEEGFGILQYPIYKGLRQTTYSALLLPMHKSPRLTIRRFALVRKILFRDMNNMAYGVEYLRHGRIETAIATKEVILSAGTLGSSKLLMLSGVGPRNHLEELGIPVRSDLPVGRNLQDHLAVHLGPFFIKEPKSFLFDRDVTPENIIRWLFLGTGPITTTGFQGAASIASSIAKSHGQGNWPDLHLILHGQAIHQGYVDAFSFAYSLQEDELIQYYSNAIGRDSFSIYVVNARPTSTGQVLLSGASINDPLVIDPRYLQDPRDADFKVMLEGVKTAMTISNTSMFRRLGTEFTKEKLPGCIDMEHLSDAYWDCYIRRFTLSLHNPVGTVSLGQVVDSNLKVKGTRGLRVVDASVQPTLVSTGTFASTLMIAEKGVDMILKDHGIPDRDTDLFDVIFGKNGFFKRNPILRILQREFDTLNPLRAIFKPFTTFTSRNAEGDEEKERFTRNGRIDNPFLQVISSVFGNSRQSDTGASGSAYVEAFESDSSKNVEDTLHVHKRSGDNSARADLDDKTNVISKNQWVLQNSPANNTFVFKVIERPSFTPVVKASHSGPKLVVKTLNITELMSSSTKPKPGKGKGGKRYALLQALLRGAEPSAVVVSKYKSSLKATTKSSEMSVPTTPSSTQVTPTQGFTATLTSTSKPIVEVVKFEKPVINNSVENEISTDEMPEKEKTLNLTKNTNSTGSRFEVKPKPVEINPQSVVGILQNINKDDNAIIPRSTTQSPLSALLNSLKSFEALMNAITAKDRRPLSLAPPPPAAAAPFSSSAERFAASPTLNWFHNNNFFSNLFGTNKKPKDVGEVDKGLGKINARSQGNDKNNNNPFQFLFGNSVNGPITTPSVKSILVTEPSVETINGTIRLALLPEKSENNATEAIQSSTEANPNSTTEASKRSTDVTTPLSKAISISEPSVEKVKSSSSAEGNSVRDKNDKKDKNDLFSSWFKPLPVNQPSSSWFKPFDKPKDPISTNSWFQPFNSAPIKKQDLQLKSTNDKSPSANKVSNNDKPVSPTAPSWFQPFKTNNARSNSGPTPIASSLKQESNPKNPLEPLNDLFNFFLGGLKNNERQSIFKTINTMAEASRGLSDLLQSDTDNEKRIATASNTLNFFEQISVGKQKPHKLPGHKLDHFERSKGSDDEKLDNLLRDLIALNNVMLARTTTTTRRPNKLVFKPISEEIDEDFILGSITTESTPIQREPEVTTEEVEVETTTNRIPESETEDEMEVDIDTEFENSQFNATKNGTADDVIKPDLLVPS